MIVADHVELLITFIENHDFVEAPSSDDEKNLYIPNNTRITIKKIPNNFTRGSFRKDNQLE